MAFDVRLKSPKEQPLFVIGAIFSGLVWAGVVVSIVGLLYAALIVAVVLIAHALFLAHVHGNGLRISAKQNPELYQRCVAASARLGLSEVPEIYILQSGGMLNAFATKLLSRKFVILLSDLVDGATDPKQLDFIVGHEVGHLAAGHLTWRGYLLPFTLLPWLGAAYSRACEYTCDRCGLAVAGDLEQSKRALVMLAAGGKQAAGADLGAFIEQQRDTGNFWMAIYELVSSHPYLCKRVAALDELHAPGTVAAPGRNPFAWFFAPVLGASAGGASSGAMLMVAYIGVVAAIAIPNFTKYQERAKANAARQLPVAPVGAADDAFGGLPTDTTELAGPEVEGSEFVDSPVAPPAKVNRTRSVAEPSRQPGVPKRVAQDRAQSPR